MTTVFTPTIPTFTSPDPIPATLVSTSTTGIGTSSLPYALDLKTKEGAWLYCRIARRVTTALTRSGYISVRRTFNSGIQWPSTVYDRVSSIAAAAASTTLSAGASIGDQTVTVASNAGLAVGQIVAISDPSAVTRLEFAQIMSINSTTIGLDRKLISAKNSADLFIVGADVFAPLWLPGGDIYEINYCNNSGQSLIFEAKSIVLPGFDGN